MKIENYHLSLDIDFETLEIHGHEIITLFLDSESELVLDCCDLQITDARMLAETMNFSLDRESKKLILQIPSSVSHEESSLHNIRIEYRGRVSEQTLHGIYKSRYDGGYFIATDFEPNGARHLFPCIDDPKFKAQFDLEVITDAKLIVTSNCPESESIQVDEKRSKHVFERTPKMSTYLFYIGIGNFDISKTVSPTGTGLRALTRPGFANKGEFALDHAKRFLQIYEEYYGIKYPLSKLDLIALPEYSAGAMENWGAITFRELGLLVDENSSSSNRRTVTEVIGHEIAHQWFGDLVTMEWWNDLWLNESFATFMETKMTDIIYPEWKVWSDFLHDMSAGAMVGDSLEGTHPIDVPVSSPEEIAQIFDDISYGKGASILRMIESWIGVEAFREGVHQYLDDFSYGNATGQSLWDKLQESAGMPVAAVMSAWIREPGYPVIKVSQHGNDILLEQERYRLKRQHNTPSFVWPIPVVATINGIRQTLLFDQQTMTLNAADNLSEIKLNSGQTGFYRVLYDKNLYSIVERKLDEMSPSDRWGIISDLYSFLLSADVEPELYFDFVRHLATDDDYPIVDAISTQLDFLRGLAPENGMLRKIYFDYYSGQIVRLGLDSKNAEADNDKIIRGRIATGLALEDQEFALTLSRKFQSYDTEDPNIRTAVAVAYARVNGENAYAGLMSAMKKKGNEADTVKIFVALTSFREPELVRKALDYSIAGEVNRADSIYAINSAAQNPFARAVTWDWVTKNIGTLQELFSGTGTVSSLLESVISRTGIGREKEVREYFSRNSISGADKGIAKGLELLEIYSGLAGRLSSSSSWNPFL